MQIRVRMMILTGHDGESEGGMKIFANYVAVVVHLHSLIITTKTILIDLRITLDDKLIQ